MNLSDESEIQTVGRQSAYLRLRQYLYIVLESGRDHFVSRVFDIFMIWLILANVLAVAIETESALGEEVRGLLRDFDFFAVIIFTVEYFARLWVAVEHPPHLHGAAWRKRLNWAMTVPMLIDLMAILPFYVGLIYPFDARVALLFRMMRFLKLARATPALGTLGRVLYNERRAIFGAVIVMLGLIVFSATIMYELEGAAQPDGFGSIPRAMWWSVATLTTIGYGDVVPITGVGKIMAGIVMIAGFGMFALPIAIISTGFAAEIHRRDFVVTWGMVARVPLFNGLSAITIGNLIQLLHAQVVERGAAIALKGEEATGMYFIMSGQVSIEFPSGAIILNEGEFFGEMALLEARKRAANITAATHCTLLKLSSSDFARFVRRHPDVQKRLEEVARDRRDDLVHRRNAVEAEMAEIVREKETLESEAPKG